MLLDDETLVSGDFVVDIGSSLPVTLTKRFADEHRAATRLTQVFTAQAGRGTGGPASIQVGRARSLTIGNVTLPFPLVGSSAVAPV